MTLMRWGKGLMLWGLVALLIAGAPAILLGLLPPALSQGFLGLLAALMSLSVVPLAALVVLAGLILWLAGRLRGDPF
ncbi:hypothetical protein [Devosia enhydra]|uniref:hypothetical protein n=1 Tax=Devosia enhydra TaxID=665118 RepID=UPI0011602E92|nr:hypothetical protein [Devosia enhydra]